MLAPVGGGGGGGGVLINLILAFKFHGGAAKSFSFLTKPD